MAYVTVVVDRVIKESSSGLALLIQFGEEEIWIPRSQIREPEDAEVGRMDFEMEISEWLAKQEGIE